MGARSDVAIRTDVLDELRWNPHVTEAGISTLVTDGVVTLRGFVPSYAEKIEAERSVEGVAGVRAVVEELEVRVPPASHQADQELAVRVARALEWDTYVPKDVITPRVQGGRVTLDGTVKFGFQRAAAERVVRNLSGVRDIANLIRIEPPQVSAIQVKQSIEAALKRQAELEASEIVVETEDGTVTLRGTVRSYADRRAAESAAWSAPGVRKVEDSLLVNAV